MRHRILGPFGATRSPHHVIDLRNLPQHVLDPMIETIDFVERRFGRKHRLQQKGPFVELGHEIGANRIPKSQRWNGEQHGDQCHEARVAK